MASESNPLLAQGEPGPVIVQNEGGASRLVLVGDHAGVAVPRRLGELGLSGAELKRHIACDLGIFELGGELSRSLDATFISQRYSRLAIDCNREPGSAGSILAESDGVVVPGNLGLTEEDGFARTRSIFAPYHARIEAELDARQDPGRETILVSLHSFTPVMAGISRPWRYGVLHRGDSRFSDGMLKALRARHGDEVGDNQPYAMDSTDFTVPHHCGLRGLDYLELEVRQDLLSCPDGVSAVADTLSEVLGRL